MEGDGAAAVFHWPVPPVTSPNPSAPSARSRPRPPCGGSIALEFSGDAEVRAVIAGEPATVLSTGMLTTGDFGPRLGMTANPERFFTPELRERTKAKLATLRAPVLFLHGDRYDLRRLNGPIIVPLMQEAGVRVEYLEYPGCGHGFHFGGGADRWGKGADERVVADVVRDERGLLDRVMPAVLDPAVLARPHSLPQPRATTAVETGP